MWKRNWWKFVIMMVVPVIVAVAQTAAIDNDSWDVIAEGREIVTNGIYFEDKLSMHEGLEVTVQNYGFSVIYYLVYSAFGAVGAYIMTLILLMLIVYLVYKIAMLFSEKNVNVAIIVAAVTGATMGLWFFATRAQMVSYVLLLLLIYILELYVRKKDTKYLKWAPVISLVQINLHASVWWILIFVTGAFIVDSVRCKKLHLQGYRTKPLIIALIFMFIAGMINPYGIKMITFIFTSYGESTSMNMIQELLPYNAREAIGRIVYVLIMFVILGYIFGDRKRIRMRYLIMGAAFFALGLNSLKGMSSLLLTMYLPLAEVYKDLPIRFPKKMRRTARWAVASWSGVVALCLGVTAAIVRLVEIPDRPREALVAAVDVIEDSAKFKGEEAADLKIYAGFNDGGYLEYRGYKPYIDPRAEVFFKANNGKADIFQEWADMIDRRMTAEEFLEKYEFNYLVVNGDEPIYEVLEDEKGYEKLYEAENEKLRVYKFK